MTFSKEVKDELLNIKSNSRREAVSELSAILRFCGGMGIAPLSLRIRNYNVKIIRHVYEAVNKTFGAGAELVMKKNNRLNKRHSYELIINDEEAARRILTETRVVDFSEGGTRPIGRISSSLTKNNLWKAFMRGAFLAGGSLSNPEKNYHMEFVAQEQDFANALLKLFHQKGLNFKTVIRKGTYVLYLKEGERIMDSLAVMGAHNALLELYNTRIIKDMRNSVNRVVNCETANIQKTVNAAGRQLESIEAIESHLGLNSLPVSLKEAAYARIDNPEASLGELRDILGSVTKSGLNHRFIKIDKIARGLKHDA